MTAATEAPATRPDLTALLANEPETVAHIILAVIGGATWRHVPTDQTSALHLYRADEPGHYCGRVSPDGCRWMPGYALPRPLYDDGDAWRLMVRESLRPRQTGPTWWRVWWMETGNSGYCEGPDPRRQTVRAALNKYATDPRWSSLIPSVIERLEQGR